MELTTAYFKKLAHDIMFDLSDEEANELTEEFSLLLEQINDLQEIDTDGVAEMIYPFETATSFLREDEVSNVVSQADALENASSVKAGHVHVPKVVK